MKYQLPPPPAGPTKGHVCAASSLTELWVAVMIVEAQVLLKDIPVTDKLSGGMNAVFAAVSAPTTVQTVTNARICGAAATEAECREVLDDWKRANPGVQGEEVVSRVPFGRVPASSLPVAEKLICLDCHVGIGVGFYCQPCTKRRWEERRQADPELANA